MISSPTAKSSVKENGAEWRLKTSLAIPNLYTFRQLLFSCSLNVHQFRAAAAQQYRSGARGGGAMRGIWTAKERGGGIFRNGCNITTTTNATSCSHKTSIVVKVRTYKPLCQLFRKGFSSSFFLYHALITTEWLDSSFIIKKVNLSLKDDRNDRCPTAV